MKLLENVRGARTGDGAVAAALALGFILAAVSPAVVVVGRFQCGNQPVRQAGLEVLFTIVAASTQCESAWRPRTRRLRLTHPNF